MARRVAITGIGVVSPIGNNVDETWEGIIAGKNGIDVITKIDISEQKVKMGAEVKNFEYPDPKEGKRMDLFSQYGVVAAGEALEMSGLKIGENIPAEKVSTYIGSGIGGIATLEEEIVKCIEKGPKYVSALLVPKLIGNMASGNIAIKYGAKGSALDIVTACSCGTHCIGEGWRAIRDGYTDAVIAGATEAPFSFVCFGGFANMKAMNTTEDKDRASIPFDKERGGFIMGEGAGVLILEEMEHAKARGANILGEVVGFGTSCDAHHITAPHPDGEGAAASMRMAIEYAGIEPSELSYINAHGTSTPLNDLYETRAIKEVLGDAAYKVPVSSTKSMIGHLLGAAGAVEAVFCVKAMNEGILPPTIGYKVPDEELDLDYVTEGARKADVKYTLSNNLGFGGHNGTVVFKRYDGE